MEFGRVPERKFRGLFFEEEWERGRGDEWVARCFHSASHL